MIEVLRSRSKDKLSLEAADAIEQLRAEIVQLKADKETLSFCRLGL
jgi:hypothetical protein